jgi:hypothetical protein
MMQQIFKPQLVKITRRGVSLPRLAHRLPLDTRSGFCTKGQSSQENITVSSMQPCMKKISSNTYVEKHSYQFKFFNP